MVLSYPWFTNRVVILVLESLESLALVAVLEYYSNIDFFCFFTSLEAVDQNDSAHLEELLCPRLKVHVKEMTSVLERAVMKRSDTYADCIQILLSHGANPDGRNGAGTPFVVLAADAGCLQILQLLVKANCCLSRCREDGATALHRAAWHGHLACLEEVMDAGAQVNSKDVQNRTPLLVAAQGNKTDCVLALLRTPGCDVSVEDDVSRTPLFWAAAFSNLVTMKALIDRGCPVNVQGPESVTSLMISAEVGNDAAVELLLQSTAQTEHRDSNYQTALLLAASNQNVVCVEKLVASGASVNALDRNGATALVHLVHSASLVETLLQNGAYPDIVTCDNLYPMWIAAEKNYCQSAVLLLRSNCKVTVPGGPENKLPLQMALYGGHVVMVKLLFTVMVAKGTPMQWIMGYLAEGNFEAHSQTSRDVLTAKTWLETNLLELSACKPLSLKCLARKSIRNLFGPCRMLAKIGTLPLPVALKKYVSLDELNQLLDQTDEGT